MKSFSNSEKKMKLLKSKEHPNVKVKAKGSAGVQTCLTSELSVLRHPLPVTLMIKSWIRGGMRRNKIIKLI